MTKILSIGFVCRQLPYSNLILAGLLMRMPFGIISFWSTSYWMVSHFKLLSLVGNLVYKWQVATIFCYMVFTFVVHFTFDIYIWLQMDIFIRGMLSQTLSWCVCVCVYVKVRYVVYEYEVFQCTRIQQEGAAILDNIVKKAW